jgi:hypothetical protein
VTQSAYIGGALVAGFALFLAARGRLTTYAAVLWGQGDAATLPPFAGVPILTVGGSPANSNKPGGGGGGGLKFLPFALPGSASAGEAAANSNWLMDAATFVETHPYVAAGA